MAESMASYAGSVERSKDCHGRRDLRPCSGRVPFSANAGDRAALEDLMQRHGLE